MVRTLASWMGLLALAGSQAGGCGSVGGGGSGTAMVVVSNSTDRFVVTVSGWDIDQNIDRTWSCTRTQARITLASSLSEGSFTLIVYDGLGAVVYDNRHEGIGGLETQTRAGAPGTWRVFLDFSDARLSGEIVLVGDTGAAEDLLSIASAFGGSGQYTFHAEWGAVQASVSIGSVSAGSVQIRIWDGSQDPDVDAPLLEADVGTGGLNTMSGPGSAGTWTIKLGLSSGALAGAISVTSSAP